MTTAAVPPPAALSRGPRDLLLAARAAWWLLLAPRLVRRAGLLPTLRLLRPRPSARFAPREALLRARRIQRFVDALMWRRPFGEKPVCWKGALVVFRLVPPGRPGDVRIVFGVEEGGEGDLLGHAWVEIEGTAVDGTEPHRYRVTLVYPE